MDGMHNTMDSTLLHATIERARAAREPENVFAAAQAAHEAGELTEGATVVFEHIDEALDGAEVL